MLQLISHGIAGFATVGHLVLSHEEKVRTAEGSASSRSTLDLKLNDPKANVERVLNFREYETYQTLFFSYLVQNARGIPYGQNLFCCIGLRPVVVHVLAVSCDAHIKLSGVRLTDSRHLISSYIPLSALVDNHLSVRWCPQNCAEMRENHIEAYIVAERCTDLVFVAEPAMSSRFIQSSKKGFPYTIDPNALCHGSAFDCCSTGFSAGSEFHG